MRCLTEDAFDASSEKKGYTGSGLCRKCCAIPVNYVDAVQLLPVAVRMLCASCREHRPSQ